MKRIIKKIRNIFLSFGVFLLLGTRKVFGISNIFNQAENFLADNRRDNIIDEQALYGVRSPREIVRQINFFVIPLAFIIGIIIYIKKSKSSIKRKIITSIISAILAVAICFGIDYVINIV